MTTALACGACGDDRPDGRPACVGLGRRPIHGCPALKKITLPEWRNAVASKQGPGNYSMRLLLLTLAVVMESEGLELRINVDELAERTGMSRRWVGVMALQAYEQGWLKRWRVPIQRGFTGFTYGPAIPTGYLRTVTHRIAEARV